MRTGTAVRCFAAALLGEAWFAAVQALGLAQCGGGRESFRLDEVCLSLL